MKKHHKYFRNLRYKQKLESMVSTTTTYWDLVFFITKDSDPRYVRENQYRFSWQKRGWPVDEKQPGKNYYIYWSRPEVDYSIQEYYTRPKYSKLKKYYKKYSNKIVRQEFKQKGYIYNNCSYKKQFDIKWTLD